MVPAFLVFPLFQLISMSIFTLAGLELMFWRRSHIFLAWTEELRKDARDALRSTQPLYLFGSVAIKRSLSSPKKNVKDVVCLLSIPNAENCASNCSNMLTPTSLRCNIPLSVISPLTIFFIESQSSFSPYILPPTHERDAKSLRRILSYLPLPDHGRVTPRISCHQIGSQNGLLTFSECSKTAQLH